MALTKQDLQQIKSIVEEAVDEKLDKKLKAFATREELDAKLDLKLSQFADRYELDDKLANLRNDFYNKIDPFLPEIQGAREAQEALSAKVYEHEEVLDQLKEIHKHQLKLAV